MALDSLTAKANVGAGTDALAGRSTAQGFVGAVMLTDNSGTEIGTGNQLPVRLLGSAEVPSFSETTTSGTTTAGAFSVSITNIGASAGTVGGVNLAAGISVNLIPRPGNTVASVAYDATGTTFYIVEMTDGLSGGGGS